MSGGMKAPHLLCLHDNKLCALRVLLRHLLALHGFGELLREGEVRDGDIVEHDAEVGCALPQRVAHRLAHLVTLRQQ